MVSQLKPVDLENYQAKNKAAGYADAYIDQQISVAKTMVNKPFDNDLISGDFIRVFKKVKNSFTIPLTRLTLGMPLIDLKAT